MGSLALHSHRALVGFIALASFAVGCDSLNLGSFTQCPGPNATDTPPAVVATAPSEPELHTAVPRPTALPPLSQWIVGRRRPGKRRCRKIRVYELTSPGVVNITFSAQVRSQSRATRK